MTPAPEPAAVRAQSQRLVVRSDRDGPSDKGLEASTPSIALGRRGSLWDVIVAASLVMLGTVNLWKVESLRALLPLDLTLLSLVLTCLVLFGGLIRARVAAMTSSDVLGNRFLWLMVGVGLALPSTRPRSPRVLKADVPPADRTFGSSRTFR
jgi:hypothetical protein